jgi:pimeloyl-ACP methyl ester carboxylesterase
MRVDEVTSADGSRIAVESVGTGPGIVVLHGAGISYREYRRLAKRLADRFTVHLYNRRGRPDSPRLTGTETVSTDVADLAAVLQGTGAVNVFGHSGGAFVAMQAGLALPLERIGVYDPAVAIAGCDFPRAFVDPFEDAVDDGDDARAIAIMGRDVNRDDLAAKLPFRLQMLIVRGYLHTPIGRRMGELLPTIGPEMRRILDNEGPASNYAAIDAQVLLASGARSAGYFHPICESLASAMPRATSIVIPRSSHNAANIAPERFVRPFAEFFSG